MINLIYSLNHIIIKIKEEVKYQYRKLIDKLHFRRFWLRKTRTIKRPTSKAIFVARIDAIGDCIIWLDQAKEFRKAFPDHRLVLLHNKVWSEIANQLPWFDECIPFDRGKIGNIKYYRHLMSTINQYTYEKAFSPVFSRDFITVDWIMHNINAKEKIGYEGDYYNNVICDFNLYYRFNKNKLNLKQLADSWYSFLVPNNPKCNMEIERNAHFVRQTINKKFLSSFPTIPFNIPQYKDLPSNDFVLLFLGASIALRMWPITNFIKITQQLPYSTIVLCGSPQEKFLSKEFIESYQGNKTIIDLTGKTTLINLISIIKNAKVVITNETSASHIAVATRTPSICLLGGGHYGRFHPYKVEIINNDDKASIPIVVIAHDQSCFKCNWGCKFPLQNGRWKCIDNIKVNDVISAIQTLTNNGSIL